MYLAELQVIAITEFTSKDFYLQSVDKGINNQFILPEKPMQNGYIERKIDSIVKLSLMLICSLILTK